MAKFTRKQGNSLWLDISYSDVNDIAPWGAGWTGSWNIKETAGGAVLLSGSLTIDAVIEGLFYYRLGPASGLIAGTTPLGTTPWATLPAGEYILTTEINHVAADFREEDQDVLVITEQALT